jgi:hypothetical protein
MNSRVYVFAKPELKEQSGKANRRHDNEGEWAEECSSACIDHNQAERKKEKTSSD